MCSQWGREGGFKSANERQIYLVFLEKHCGLQAVGGTGYQEVDKAGRGPTALRASVGSGQDTNGPSKWGNWGDFNEGCGQG